MRRIVRLLLAAIIVAWTSTAFAMPRGKAIVAGGELIEDIEGSIRSPMRTVNGVSWSPDGKRVATGSADSSARIWDAATGVELISLIGHKGAVRGISWSPDGKRVLTGSDDNSARIWDAATGVELINLKGDSDDWFLSVAWSPDGKRVATGTTSMTRNSARIWDATTGEALINLKGHSSWIRSVAWSPDGKRVLTGSDDKSARIWDAATGAELINLKGHAEKVRGVAWSPDGTLVLTGSDDNSARIWDAATGKELINLKGNADSVRSVAWSPDGNRVAIGSRDNSAHIWDAATGAELISLNGHGDTILSVAWSPDGRRVATGSDDNSARIWDPATGATLIDLKGYSGSIRSAVWSPDGKRVATGSQDNSACIWDAATGEELINLKGHAGSVRSVAWSADGKRVLTGSEDDSARIWDAATGAGLINLNHTGTVLSVAWSPDGRRVLTGSYDQSARIWDAATGVELLNLKGITGRVLTVAWSPDGKRVLTGSDDNSARIWDAATGAQLINLKGNADWFLSVAWSPDGRRVLTGATGESARIWDAATGAVLINLKGHSSWIRSVAWSPDGKRVLTGSDDKSARIWDAATGAELINLKGHAGPVLSVAWSPDGRRVLTGSDDNSTRIWLDSGAPILAMIAGPDGRWLKCEMQTRICLRHDDGSMLRYPGPGVIRPILLPGASKEPKFESTFAFAPVAVDDGGMYEPAPAGLIVRNLGGAAYGVRLLVEEDGDATDDRISNGLRIAPVVQSPIPIVREGDEVTLPLRVFASAREHDPLPGIAKIRVTLVHTRDRQIMGTFALSVRAPKLEAGRATLQSGADSSLRIPIRNTGNATSGPIVVDTPQGLLNPNAPRAQAFRGIAPSSDPERDLEVRYSLSTEQTSMLTTTPTVTIAARTDLTDSAKRSDKPKFVYHTWTLTLPVERVNALWGFAWLIAAATLVAAGVIVYTTLVLRNPLLVSVSGTPATLMTIPIGELPRLRRLLQWAGRFEATLGEATVSRSRFEQALAFIDAEDAADRATTLAERLDLKPAGSTQETQKGSYVADYETSARLLLNLPRVRLAFPRAGIDARDLIADLRKLPNSMDAMTIAVMPDPAAARELRDAVRESAALIAILSPQDLSGILLSSDSQQIFARVLADQTPPSRLSAYQRGAGVSRAGAFFGRDVELSTILNRDLGNYFIVGGRQVGKSSLLKELQRRFDARGDVVCVYLALDDAELQRHLVAALGLPEGATIEAAFTELSRPGAPRRIILIDEADLFIAAESSNEYRNLAVFRHLSEERRAHFILAGFWELYRSMAFDYASPLRNFGEQIHIGALDEPAGRALATQPMHALSLTYEYPALVTVIYEKTGGRANLMVTVCDQLITQLPIGARMIPAALVYDVLQGHEVRSQLEGWRALSGTAPAAERVNRLDRIIVYATIDRESFDIREIQQVIADADLGFTTGDIRESLARLTLAYILDRRSDGRYRYLVPLFIEMQREENLPAALASEIAHARKS